MPNSSGAQDRFYLPPAANPNPNLPGNIRAYFTGDLPDQPLGGNQVDGTVSANEDQTQNGVPIDDGGATIVLETSVDNVTWATVATVTVVNRATQPISGSVGPYFRFRNIAANPVGGAWVVARFSRNAQQIPAL